MGNGEEGGGGRQGAVETQTSSRGPESSCEPHLKVSVLSAGELQSLPTDQQLVSGTARTKPGSCPTPSPSMILSMSPLQVVSSPTWTSLPIWTLTS